MKVEFITGLMGSGKTAKLIEEYHKEPRQPVVRVIPFDNSESVDTRIISRNGKSLDNVIPIYTGDVLRNQFEALEEAFSSSPINVPVLIDEVQFLQPNVIRKIFSLSIETGRETKLYGLHSDFRGDTFQAVKQISLFIPYCEWSHILMECEEDLCREEAKYNARFLSDGSIDISGPIIVEEKTRYMSICKNHFNFYCKNH